jgi:hypothetical protein
VSNSIKFLEEQYQKLREEARIENEKSKIEESYQKGRREVRESFLYTLEMFLQKQEKQKKEEEPVVVYGFEDEDEYYKLLMDAGLTEEQAISVIEQHKIARGAVPSPTNHPSRELTAGNLEEGEYISLSDEQRDRFYELRDKGYTLSASMRTVLNDSIVDKEDREIFKTLCNDGMSPVEAYRKATSFDGEELTLGELEYVHRKVEDGYDNRKSKIDALSRRNTTIEIAYPLFIPKIAEKAKKLQTVEGLRRKIAEIRAIREVFSGDDLKEFEDILGIGIYHIDAYLKVMENAPKKLPKKKRPTMREAMEGAMDNADS